VSLVLQYARLTPSELARLRVLLVQDPDGAFDFTDEVSSDWPDEAPLAWRRGYGAGPHWAGLRFLLDRAGPPTVDLLTGGGQLTADEWGAAPPRLLTPADLAAGMRFWRATPFPRLAGYFDPAAMNGVGPGRWAELTDAYELLAQCHADLTEFLGAAADRGDAVVSWLS